MKTPRNTDRQISAIVKQTESGTSVPALRREHGISSAAFYEYHTNHGPSWASPHSRNWLSRADLHF